MNTTPSDDALVLYGQILFQPPAAGHGALPVAGRARSRGAARAPGHGHGLAAPPGQRRRGRRPQQLLGAAARARRAGAAQHRRLPQRAGSHHHRADGARGVRHALDQARTDRRRLHAAARHAEPGRRGRAAHPRRLPGAALLHRRPGAVPAPGRCRLPGRHALGRADRHRARPGQPLCAAGAARAARRAAAGRRGPGPALARLPGDGMGLRRRAAEHRRGAGAGPGRDGRRLCRRRAGRPQRPPRRCHGRRRTAPSPARRCSARRSGTTNSPRPETFL